MSIVPCADVKTIIRLLWGKGERFKRFGDGWRGAKERVHEESLQWDGIIGEVCKQAFDLCS